MDKCYICGNYFDENNVKKHDEHIIQQAIGGNLTANDILCSSCGGDLGQKIDVSFNSIFDVIATRMDIKKDRQSNKKKAVNGKMGHIDVIWKDSKISPIQPYHLYTIDKQQVIIYANQTTAKKYKQKVEQEIQENFTYQQPEIIICDNLKGIVTFPFNIDDKAFKKGLAKIAIGFASSHGIKREEMPLVLEINKTSNKANISNTIVAIPFYPFGIIDKLIEVQKNEFEHYPFHNLILFTVDCNPQDSIGKKVLMCYIELFSTFQWYVVLNEEYYGNSGLMEKISG